MNKLFLPILALMFALRCSAQVLGAQSPAPIKGTFYVSVDDAATIYVNGQKAHDAKFGETRSAEMDLSEGDRIVVQLRNDSGPRHFLLLFTSTDGNSIISFKKIDFKIVPDVGVTDFTPDQFQKWTKHANEEKQHKPVKLPAGSASEYLWGDLDSCTIAGTITAHMIYQKQRK